MKIVLSVIVLGLTFIGCTGSRIITNSKFEGKDFTSKSIFIVPFSEEIINVVNKDDVVDDFAIDKRSPNLIIKDSVYKYICNNVKRSLRGIVLYRAKDTLNICLSQKDTSKYFSVMKKFGHDTNEYFFYVPKREILIAANVNADIVLVMNEISFERNSRNYAGHFIPGATVSTPGGSFTTPGSFLGGGSSEFLGANYSFIIYDYNEDDVISYGNSSVATSFIFAMTKSTWDTTFDRISDEIFYKTPFKWIKSKFYGSFYH